MGGEEKPRKEEEGRSDRILDLFVPGNSDDSRAHLLSLVSVRKGYIRLSQACLCSLDRTRNSSM